MAAMSTAAEWKAALLKVLDTAIGTQPDSWRRAGLSDEHVSQIITELNNHRKAKARRVLKQPNYHERFNPYNRP